MRIVLDAAVCLQSEVYCSQLGFFAYSCAWEPFCLQLELLVYSQLDPRGWGARSWLVVTDPPHTKIQNPSETQRPKLFPEIHPKSHSRKILVSAKNFCPQFWGRKWLPQFCGHLEKLRSFCRNTSMPIKFLVLGGGGGDFGFWGGGSVDFIFVGARIFLNQNRSKIGQQ